MHPAFSVIFFTAASGAGYGLLVWLGVFGALGLLPPDRWFGVAAFGLAFGLVTAGLLSSTFHLGHPERAWRALTQWKTSWLSREGVMAVLTYIPAGLHAAGWIFLERNDGVLAALGLAGTALCLVTIWCTAMIYASLKTIQRWSHRLVPLVYLLLAGATGALLLVMLTSLFGIASPLLPVAALALVGLAGGVKIGYWRSIDASRSESTAASATGLGKPGLVQLLEAPHTESNYLMQEMGYRIARKHAGRLRIIAFVALIAVPMLSMAAIVAITMTAPDAWLAVAAVAFAAAGVLVERWLFFAEAKHVVTLYYGATTA